MFLCVTTIRPIGQISGNLIFRFPFNIVAGSFYCSEQKHLPLP